MYSLLCLNSYCDTNAVGYLCKYALQNPNDLDSKVTLDFDHVKKSLKVDDEGKPLTEFYLSVLLSL